MSSHDVSEPPFVVSLTDPVATRLQTAQLGSKGARLVQLTDAGFPVPAGVCVTTRVFDRTAREAIESQGETLAHLEPTETAKIRETGARLRETIRAAPMDETVTAAIETAIAELSGGPYAVRSSATAEDRPGRSFAGQYETFLGVDDEAVCDRIRECFASLFTDRALTYRRSLDRGLDDLAMAVIVQEQVPADSAGVLFTADPQTSSRSTAVIEATTGLATGVVDGTEPTDRIEVDRDHTAVSSYEPAADHRVLSTQQITALVECGRNVESVFECPQDIEWAFADEGLFVLQTRPITTLFPRPSPLPDDDRRHVYVSIGHGQAYAEALPPLVCSFWKHNASELLGGQTNGLIVSAGGRLYIDVTAPFSVPGGPSMLARLFGAINGSIAAGLESLRDRETPTARPSRETCSQLYALGTAFVPFWRAQVPAFVDAFVDPPDTPDREKARWAEWASTLASEVTRHESLEERVSAAVSAMGRTDDYPPVGRLYAAMAIDRWLAHRFGDDPETSAAVTAIGRGFPEELITELMGELQACARIAGDHPALAEALERGVTVSDCRQYPGGEAFVSRFESVLAEYGHRATGEIDISNPRWRDDPEPLLATIRARLDEDQTHEERIDALQQAAQQAQTVLEARAGGPVRRWLLARVLRTYRAYVQTRELPKHAVARLFAAVHDTISEAGTVLVEQGRIEAESDVWLLRFSELQDGLAGTPIDVDCRRRRAAFEREQALTPPPVLLSDGETITGTIERDDVPADALVGVGVSDGVVEGRVAVVTDPTSESIAPGDILVAPACGPGWTPLFANASGLVMAVGGQLSHGALVAREYGLPAVASVADATDRLQTGDRVRLDGERGVVEPID